MTDRDLASRFSRIIDDLDRISRINSRQKSLPREIVTGEIPSITRPTLGEHVSLDYFRLVRLFVLGEVVGLGAAARRLLSRAGEKIGRSRPVSTLDDVAAFLQGMKIANAEISLQPGAAGGREKIIVRCRESAVSTGVAVLGEPICDLEGGIIAGMLSRLYDKKAVVTETKCIATGYDYCQFEAVFEDKRRRPAAADGGDHFDYSEENVQLLTTLSAHALSALENAMLYEHTKKKVITDQLTGAHNYAYFQMRLKEEIQRSERQNRAFSLAMVDIDEFKVFNDRYGHPAGDAILKEVARLITASVRGIDILCRYGGDEFVLILPQTGREEARPVLERVRQAVEKNVATLTVRGEGLSLRSTVSLGCAVFPDDSRYSEQLTEQADHALYEAKKAGRNRVCFFNENPPA